MHEIIDVQTGGVAVGLAGSELKSSGIGSCVVVILMNTEHSMAGIAHTMLPGRCPDGANNEKTRYVENALDILVSMLKAVGVEPHKLVACIVGGGNVLKREDAGICEMNVKSVRNGLKDRGIKIVAEDVGGLERRKVTVDVSGKTVWFTRGDGEEALLFSLKDSSGSSNRELQDIEV